MQNVSITTAQNIYTFCYQIIIQELSKKWVDFGKPLLIMRPLLKFCPPPHFLIKPHFTPPPPPPSIDQMSKQQW